MTLATNRNSENDWEGIVKDTIAIRSLFGRFVITKKSPFCLLANGLSVHPNCDCKREEPSKLEHHTQ
jgi:hypothetical protein